MVVRYFTEKGTICVSEFVEAELINDNNILFIGVEICDICVHLSECSYPKFSALKILDAIYATGKVDLTTDSFSEVKVETLQVR